jgi:hypothetical protein
VTNSPTSAQFPAGFDEGLRRFNRGDYFEAHEAFEELLDDVESDERWELLVALVQVAVGYHKAASGHPGAERMLGLGAEKLAPFAPVVRGVEVGALRERVAEDLAAARAGASLAERLRESPPRIRLA